eukprot:TRINITY_DN15836_c0_g1_i1.p1 TRINITY_DN15836_c0_g1~~TRINITY_DN15836_c0_g1_i1.p1  ORF type:complete len:1528 (+),score=376.92 TRINITY_DN15836_c0_g1_i1:68-4585(+)
MPHTTLPPSEPAPLPPDPASTSPPPPRSGRSPASRPRPAGPLLPLRPAPSALPNAAPLGPVGGLPRLSTSPPGVPPAPPAPQPQSAPSAGSPPRPLGAPAQLTAAGLATPPGQWRGHQPWCVMALSPSGVLSPDYSECPACGAQRREGAAVGNGRPAARALPRSRPVVLWGPQRGRRLSELVKDAQPPRRRRPSGGDEAVPLSLQPPPPSTGAESEGQPGSPGVQWAELGSAGRAVGPGAAAAADAAVAAAAATVAAAAGPPAPEVSSPSRPPTLGPVSSRPSCSGSPASYISMGTPPESWNNRATIATVPIRRSGPPPGSTMPTIIDLAPIDSSGRRPSDARDFDGDDPLGQPGSATRAADGTQAKEPTQGRLKKRAPPPIGGTQPMDTQPSDAQGTDLATTTCGWGDLLADSALQDIRLSPTNADRNQVAAPALPELQLLQPNGTQAPVDLPKFLPNGMSVSKAVTVAGGESSTLHISQLERLIAQAAEKQQQARLLPPSPGANPSPTTPKASRDSRRPGSIHFSEIPLVRGESNVSGLTRGRMGYTARRQPLAVRLASSIAGFDGSVCGQGSRPVSRRLSCPPSEASSQPRLGVVGVLDALGKAGASGSVNVALQDGAEGGGLGVDYDPETLVISQVHPGGPADKAGVLEGCRITSVGDAQVADAKGLEARLAECRARDIPAELGVAAVAAPIAGDVVRVQRTFHSGGGHSKVLLTEGLKGKCVDSADGNAAVEFHGMTRPVWIARCHFAHLEVTRGGEVAIKEVFDSCAPSGAASEKELGAMLKKLGISPAFGDLLLKLLHAEDGNGPGDPVSARAFVNVLSRLTGDDPGERIKMAFRLYNADGSGEIGRAELAAALAASVKASNFALDRQKLDLLTDAIFEAADVQGRGVIDYADFVRMLREHPDICEALTLGVPCSPKSASPKTAGFSQAKEQKPKQQQCRPSKRLLAAVCAGLTALGCFLWYFVQYAVNWPDGDASEADLMGWSLPFAKGCAAALKPVLFLLTMCVCRRFTTLLRETPLRKIIPFDHIIAAHQWLALAAMVLALGHVLAHVSDVWRCTDDARSHLWMKATGGEPQPNVGDFLQKPIAVTGIIALVCWLLAYPFAVKYPRTSVKVKEKCPGCYKFLNNFNHFWLMHQLLPLSLVILCFHPVPSLPFASKSALDFRGDTIWWIGVPVAIYWGERIFRAFRSRALTSTVLRARMLPGKVMELRLTKPSMWPHRPGQYAFLKWTKISRYEWHPFTVTSAPEDPFIMFHIREAGDWTGRLHELLKGSQIDDATVMQSTTPTAGGGPTANLLDERPRLGVDGPLGAPAQGWEKFRAVLLVGAGIGVTPFASILRDLAHKMDAARCPHCNKATMAPFQTKRVYFYFVCRSADEATWFSGTIDDIVAELDSGFIDINIHVTRAVAQEDVRSALLAVGQRIVLQRGGRDVVTGMNVRTRFGRPEWNTVFRSIARDNPLTKIGVFCCAPTPLVNELRRNCEKHTTKDVRFVCKAEVFS